MTAAREAEGPAAVPEVEREVVVDMLRRALPLLPVLIALCWLLGGREAAVSAGLAVGLVLVNFVLAAALLAWGAGNSPAVLMGAALGGFLLRMLLLAGALLVLRQQSWVNVTLLGLTLLVSHVGLLVWELRRVSASLAYPGLKPSPLEKTDPPALVQPALDSKGT